MSGIPQPPARFGLASAADVTPPGAQAARLEAMMIGEATNLTRRLVHLAQFGAGGGVPAAGIVTHLRRNNRVLSDLARSIKRLHRAFGHDPVFHEARHVLVLAGSLRRGSPGQFGRANSAEQIRDEKAADQIAAARTADQLELEETSDQFAAAKRQDQIAVAETADQIRSEETADQFVGAKGADQFAAVGIPGLWPSAVPFS